MNDGPLSEVRLQNQKRKGKAWKDGWIYCFQFAWDKRKIIIYILGYDRYIFMVLTFIILILTILMSHIQTLPDCGNICCGNILSCQTRNIVTAINIANIRRGDI